MRIGVITTSYPRHPDDAAGIFVAELTRWIASRGYQVEVVAAGIGGENDGFHGHPVHRVPAPAGLFYTGGAPEALAGGLKASSLRFSLRMLREIRRRRGHWDGAVAHWLLPSGLAGGLSMGRKPLWCIAHGGDIELVCRLGVAPFLVCLLDRPQCHLHCVSRHGLDALRSTSQGRWSGRATTRASLLARASVAPMGLCLDDFAPLRWNPPPRSAYVLFVGRLVPIKGVDVLIRAHAILSKLAGPDHVAGQEIGAPPALVIAGDGPERDRLQAQATRLGVRALFVGQKEPDACRALMSQAGAVVVPSRESLGRVEGTPRVALEALAVGTPLIVSMSGGLAELPDSICQKVPADDPQALAAALFDILAGKRAPHRPGHWLQALDWEELGPRILPGLSQLRLSAPGA